MTDAETAAFLRRVYPCRRPAPADEAGHRCAIRRWLVDWDGGDSPLFPGQWQLSDAGRRLVEASR